MNKTELRNIMGEVIRNVREEADVMEAIVPHLPELPDSAEYTAFNSFPVRQFACLALDLATNTRENAFDLLTLFPPEPMRYFAGEQPYFRPELQQQFYERRGVPIEPFIFSATLRLDLPEAERHVNKLVWYYKPLPDVPDTQLIMSAIIREDSARVFETDTMDLPDGITILDGIPQNGIRTAVVFWRYGTDARAGLLSGAADTEWPDTFTETV